MKLDDLRAALRGPKEVPEATTVSHEGGGMREAVMSEELFLQHKGMCPDCMREMAQTERDVLAGTSVFRCPNCGFACTVSDASVRSLWLLR